MYWNPLLLFIHILSVLAELRENTSEDHKSLETYNRQHVLKASRDSFVDKPSTCSSYVRLPTAKKFKPEIEAVSENPKAFCDENINSRRELFPIQSCCTAQSVMFQNAPGVSPSRNGVQRRTPFRELNGNSKQEKNKQIIWRPWWIRGFHGQSRNEYRYSSEKTNTRSLRIPSEETLSSLENVILIERATKYASALDRRMSLGAQNTGKKCVL